MTNPKPDPSEQCACACLHVRYDPADVWIDAPATDEAPAFSGMGKRDRWRCPDCGSEFVRAAGLADLRRQLGEAKGKLEWIGHITGEGSCLEPDQMVNEVYLLVAGESQSGLADLQREVERLRGAAQDFVDKVDSGRALSKDSYAKFKAALDEKGSEKKDQPEPSSG